MGHATKILLISLESVPLWDPCARMFRGFSPAFDRALAGWRGCCCQLLWGHALPPSRPSSPRGRTPFPPPTPLGVGPFLDGLVFADGCSLMRLVVLVPARVTFGGPTLLCPYKPPPSFSSPLWTSIRVRCVHAASAFGGNFRIENSYLWLYVFVSPRTENVFFCRSDRRCLLPWGVRCDLGGRFPRRWPEVVGGEFGHRQS